MQLIILVLGKMMVDFRKCVIELEHWKEGKAVILCGNDGFFCSGGDLDFARATGTPKEGFDMSCWMQDILKRFRRLPLVSSFVRFIKIILLMILSSVSLRRQ